MLVAYCLRTAATLIAVLGVCGAVAAAELFTFDLPRMPLDDALRQYNTQTGRSVLFDTKQVQGRTSAPVRGRFSADAALQRLIAKTGGAACQFGMNMVFEMCDARGRRRLSRQRLRLCAGPSLDFNTQESRK